MRRQRKGGTNDHDEYYLQIGQGGKQPLGGKCGTILDPHPDSIVGDVKEDGESAS